MLGTNGRQRELKAHDRALIQLVLEHRHSYEDVAKLLATDRAAIQSRVRAAITAVAGEDPDREVPVTDYMCGEASAAQRAHVIRYLHADEEVQHRMETLRLKLTVIAPGAELPPLPKRATPAREEEPRGLPPRRSWPRGLPSRLWREARGRLRRTGRGVSRRAGWPVIGGAGAVLLLTAGVASQLVLPNILEGRLRAQLERVGSVERIEVGAFPAVKAIWGGMDSLDVELGEMDAAALRAGSGGDGDTVLERLTGTDDVNVAIASLALGPATLEDVALSKRGDRLTARMTVDPDALAGALPLADGIDAKLAARDGSLQLVVTGGPLGDRPQTMEVQAQDGQLVGALRLSERDAEELGVPAGMEPPPQQLFANEQLAFETVRAQPSGDKLVLSVEATLREPREPASAPAPGAGGAAQQPGGAGQPESARPPSGGTAPPPASGSAGGLPPELVECLADQGVELPPDGGLPAGLDPQEIQRAVQACSAHVPQGALP